MSRGWRYEVWSEPDPHVLENVRFLELGVSARPTQKSRPASKPNSS